MNFIVTLFGEIKTLSVETGSSTNTNNVISLLQGRIFSTTTTYESFFGVKIMSRWESREMNQSSLVHLLYALSQSSIHTHTVRN